MRDTLSDRLLTWYDSHARDLPWRLPPGDETRPDPYRIWLSEVMLQQTTVATVRDYFAKFTRIWPNVHALAAAEDADVMAAWAGLGYYARARNLLACARVVSHQLEGRFPQTEEELHKLPGIGPYTAAAIAAIAFDQRAVVVDGNVERVMSRLRAIETPLPNSKPLIREAADALTPNLRAGDYAQAVMDLGATVCTPRAPSCLLCPWERACEGRLRGIATDLPRKAPKKPKPTRQGFVYLARRGPEWLLVRRPNKGLLGGMLAFPTSDWGEDPTPDPPVTADWIERGEVRHTFTHFHLVLRVLETETRSNPTRGAWQHLDPDALPTVFAKAYTLITEP